MCTYVRTYVRACVRTLRPNARKNVRTSIPKAYIQNGHKLTRVRTCVFSGSEASKLLANSFQKAPTRHKIIQRRGRRRQDAPRNASKGARAHSDSPRDAPKTPSQVSGEPTYVRTRKKSAQASPTTPPRTPQKPKIAPNWSRRDQDGPCIAPACSKGRFGVNVGPILSQCLLRLKVFSTSLLSRITHVRA